MFLSHEPRPVEIVNPSACSRLVLVCDHASNRLPQSLGTLGLPPGAIDTHIGWDIGAAAVARLLSDWLDAPLVLSGYSRLVIDMNRPTHVASSIPVTSGGVPIAGNVGLDAAERETRIRTFFDPYHNAIRALLDDRSSTSVLRTPVPARATSVLGTPVPSHLLSKPTAGGPVLLAIHSFTPALLGEARPWPVGMLYGKDTRLAHAFLERLRRDSTLLVGDNQPYHVSPESDWTIPTHGDARGILNTAIEIRQDGVSDPAGVVAWAQRLAEVYRDIPEVQ